MIYNFIEWVVFKTYNVLQISPPTVFLRAHHPTSLPPSQTHFCLAFIVWTSDFSVLLTLWFGYITISHTHITDKSETSSSCSHITCLSYIVTSHIDLFSSLSFSLPYIEGWHKHPYFNNVHFLVQLFYLTQIREIFFACGQTPQEMLSTQLYLSYLREPLGISQSNPIFIEK